MKQREVGVSVGGKANFSTHGAKVEGSAVVKAGFSWENYDTGRNINYLPNDVQKTTVYDLFRESL